MPERPPRDMSAAFALGLSIAFFGIAFALYLPGLGGPLLLDDMHTVVPLMEAAARGELGLEHLITEAGPLGRPIAMSSFAANAALHGADAWYWKATNVAVHALTALALYALLVRLGCVCGAGVRDARFAATIGALAWLVHPLHVSTVLYTVQRMTELSALFSILALLSYVEGRDAVSRGRPGAAAMVAAFVVFTPLAALSKETGLLAPLLLACVELTVFARVPRPGWVSALFLVAFVVPYGAVLAYLLGDLESRVLSGYGMRDFTPLERLMTQAHVLLDYLRWIVLPNRADMGFYHDDVEVTRSLGSDPAAVAGTLLTAGALCAAWLVRARAPLAALGIVFFFAAHVLESTVFGLELAFEHRNYLPSVGVVVLCLGVATVSAYGRLLAVAGVLVAIVFAAAAGERARLWGNEGRLYAAFLESHPLSVRARVTLAEWLVARRDFESALATLDGFEHLTLATHRLRVLCARDGAAGPDQQAVFAAVVRSQVASHFEADALALIARLAVDGECEADEQALAGALEAAAGHRLPSGRRHRALVYAAMLRQRGGELGAALTLLRQATALQPDDAFPLYLGAEWAAGAGDDPAARGLLAEARALAVRGRRDYAPIDAAVAEMIGTR